MKRVKVNAWTKALVFKNNNYVKLLNEGKYWISPFNEVKEFAMDKPFIAPVNLNILLKDKEFVDAVIIVEVKNNEIVLQYENGLFMNVLAPGRYIFWKGLVNYKFMVVDLNEIDMDIGLDQSLLSRKELAP